MNDLIYRNDAIDALAYFDEKSPTGKTTQDIIISLPPAQPEIIMCKDCKMWDQVPSSTIAPEYHRCRAYSSTQLHTTAMDFCSRAERKEDG